MFLLCACALDQNYILYFEVFEFPNNMQKEFCKSAMAFESYQKNLYYLSVFRACALNQKITFCNLKCLSFLITCKKNFENRIKQTQVIGVTVS